MANLPRQTTLILADNYIASIKNAVGTELFRNLYAVVNGRKTDLLNNGELSCAVFVSSILYLYKLINNLHATVNSTVKDLQDFGWLEITEPKIGCILIWEKTDFGGRDNLHKHIGFYIGDNMAISNDYKSGVPEKHDWKYNNERKVELILWNPKLVKNK